MWVYSQTRWFWWLFSCALEIELLFQCELLQRQEFYLLAKMLLRHFKFSNLSCGIKNYVQVHWENLSMNEEHETEISRGIFQSLYLQNLEFEPSVDLNLDSKLELVTITAVIFPPFPFPPYFVCKQEESSRCHRTSFPQKHSSGNACLSPLWSENNSFYVAVSHFLSKLFLLYNM